MSLILDALNRSRQDSEQMPGLSSDHFVDPPAAGTNWMQWLLVCGLALAVVVIGWLLFDKLPQPMPVVEAPARSAEPSAPVAVSVPAQPAAKPLPAPGAVPERRRMAVELAVVEEPGARALEVQPIEATPPPKSAPVPVDPSVSALYQQQDKAVPAATQPRARPATAVATTAEQPRASSRSEETVDIESLVEAAQAELADARLSEREEPLLSDLSQQTKDAIPTLMYLRHDYSGNPAKSSVVINGMTLRPAVP